MKGEKCQLENKEKRIAKCEDRINDVWCNNCHKAELQKQKEEIIKEIRKLDIPAYLYSSKTFERDCAEKTIITLINRLEDKLKRADKE